MRIFVSIIVFIMFLFSLVYILLFTSIGNNILKPYVGKIIAKNIDHDVNIESLTLKPDFLDFEMVIDHNATLVVNGKINLFKQNFDLIYKIDVNNLRTPYLTITSHMLLDGNLKGNRHEYTINGEGTAFKSKTKFLVAIKDKKVRTLQIDAKSLRIEDILAFLNQPIYTHGVLSASADLVSDDGENFAGTIKNTIYFGVLNNDVIAKHFGIKLKDAISYKGSVNSKISNDIIYSSGNILSNIAQLKFNKSEYHLANQRFSADYALVLPSLGLLPPVVGQKLKGEMRLSGNIMMEGDNRVIKAQSKTFGGLIDLSVINQQATLHFVGLQAAKVWDMFEAKRYTDALIDGDITIDDLSKGVFQSDVRVHDGHFVAQNMSALLETDFPQNSTFSLHVHSENRDQNITNSVDFLSNLASLKSPNIMYDPKTQQYEGDYNLSVGKLENMEFLTNMKLRGTLDVTGRFLGVDNNITLTGMSGFLDSNSSFDLTNNLLDVRIQNLSALRMSHAAFLPEIFDSQVDANITYDLISKQGRFSALAPTGQFKAGETSDLIFMLSGYDLTHERFIDSNLTGTIDHDDTNFALYMGSDGGYLKIPAGHVNLADKNINASFQLKIKDKDLNGNIKGDIHHPKVDVKSSTYIKKKINDVIDKHVPKDLKEPIKDLLKLFN
ncbi:hypothetical protein [Sulfurospirillum sp. 1612]|uniref:hypothetical protein n=1 Tax=Sulfurospirillum sp. 1612 TaxID=3094835 RepID=UPI002F9439BA